MLALFDGKRYPVVFAGGSINADIYARNSSQQPNGGKIGSVGAHGSIDGLFKAQSAIDEVFAGGDIDAILDAPTVATPRANDPSVVTDYPLPATPDSVKPDVLADAAAVYAEVLADVDAVFAAKDDLFAAIAALEADVHDDVATARAELAEATEQTAARAAEALEDRRKGVADAFAKLRAAALKKRDAALSEAKSSREGFAKQIAAEADSHGQAVAQANAKKADVIAQFNTAQRAMQAKRTEAIAQADRLEQLRQKIWKERLISLTEYAEEVAKAAKARAEYLRTINGRIQELQNSSNGMDQLRGLRFEMLKDMMGDDGFMQYLADMEQTLWIATWFGNLFASVVPGLNWIMSGYAAGHGKDMWGNKLSNFERALNHIFFLLPFLPPAAKAGAATGKMTAAGAKGLAQYGKRLHAASKAKFAQMAARREAMAGIRQYQKNVARNGSGILNPKQAGRFERSIESRVSKQYDATALKQHGRNPHGQHGAPDHKAAVKELVKRAEKEFPGDKIHQGTSIRDKTGVNRRPDVWVEDASTKQVKKVYEAARKNKDGSWVKRERDKLDDYTRAGIPNEFQEVL